ncbi:hypothetical protein [Acaryochloris marina]|uniref:Uncharacterized protein n=1 Tax=Acaryochloris marina (strain MBIC 11017) TaxID=329726 RepID=A8ZN05_ACAM1|nr:hypothetical protein [Acaryochloris marina]ABW32204.1 conserved hypothetical protein [Acaryochloris marina MBIC11017]
MVKYTLKEEPETVIEIPGKDSKKTRSKAMEQLVEMMDNGQLKTTLDRGFGLNDFIEVQEKSHNEPSAEEDEVAQAVQVLNRLASLKLKLQDTQQDALEIRAIVDLLFTDSPISEEDVHRLKQGFKLLKKFAQANIQYREARSQAEAARAILDQALQSELPASQES